MGDLCPTPSVSDLSVTFEELISRADKLRNLNSDAVENDIKPILDKKFMSGLSAAISPLESVLNTKRYEMRYSIIIEKYGGTIEIEHNPPFSSFVRVVISYAGLFLLFIPSMLLSSVLECAVDMRYPSDISEDKHKWLIDNFIAISNEVKGGLDFAKKVSTEFSNDPNVDDSIVVALHGVKYLKKFIIDPHNLDSNKPVN